jgi:hypothetical protein
MAEKKEAIPTETVRRRVQEIQDNPKLDREAKMKALIRLARGESSTRNRSEANLQYIRGVILELSGGAFEPLAASAFTEASCSETAYTLQGPSAQMAFSGLEKLLSAAIPNTKERKEIYTLEKVPHLKIDWKKLAAALAKAKKQTLYRKARQTVGTYLSFSVGPVSKETREGK